MDTPAAMGSCCRRRHLATWTKRGAADASPREASAPAPNTAGFVSQYYGEVDADAVLAYLKRKGLAHTVVAGEARVRECPFCHAHKNNPANLHKLYVNTRNGVYMCHRCGASGNWFQFKAALGDGAAAMGAGGGGAGGGGHAQAAQIQDLMNSGGGMGGGMGGGGAQVQQQQQQQRGKGGKGNKGNQGNKGGGGAGAAGAQHPNAVPAPGEDRVRQTIASLWDAPRFADVLAYLRDDRGLSDATLELYGVGAAEYRFPDKDRGGAWRAFPCMTFPLVASVRGKDGGVEAFRTTRLKARGLRQKGQQRLDPAGGGWGLFGLHTVPLGAREVVLTEGEFDAMAVHQGTGLPAVSLPNGASSLPLEILPELERFERVVLWMDNDGPGQQGAEKFAKKLGSRRCAIVRPSGHAAMDAALLGMVDPDQANAEDNAEDGDGDGDAKENEGGGDGGAFTPAAAAFPKDANDALRDPACDMARLVRDAQPLPHSEIASFMDLQGEVFHELTHREQVAGVKPTTLPRFAALVKGHRRGELSIYTGPTGSGKTTMLSQLSLDYALQGVNTLWGSFEIKNTRLLQHMLVQYAGITGRRDLVLERQGVRDARVQAQRAFNAREHAAAAGGDPRAAGGAGPLPVGGVASSLSGARPQTDQVPLQMREEAAQGGELTPETFAAFASEFSELPLHFLRFYGSTQVEKVLDAMEYAVYAYDVEHVVLDNLQFMLSGQGTGWDRMDAQDYALQAFRKFASAKNVHISLVIHPRKEPEGAPLSIASIFGSAKATQEADTVVIMQHDQMNKRKYLEVKKNRFDGTLGAVPVRFDQACRTFTDNFAKGAKGGGNVAREHQSQGWQEKGMPPGQGGQQHGGQQVGGNGSRAGRGALVGGSNNGAADAGGGGGWGQGQGDQQN